VKTLTVNQKLFEEKCYQLRRRFIELFSNLGFGHLTSAFSITEILVVLYYKIMRYNTENPLDMKRDRFVLSKGHGAGMLFPIYEDLNLITKEKLESSIKIGGDLSCLQEWFYPGFTFYGGSLGIGLGMACGLAKGAQLNRQDWLTFCIVGDAECYEGSIWEAIAFAGHHHLNNLIMIIDRNYLGCSDFTENMLALEPLDEKIRSFHWDVCEADGHNGEELYSSLQNIRARPSRNPFCLIAKTTKGHNLNYTENHPLMHGYIPSKAEREKALEELIL